MAKRELLNDVAAFKVSLCDRIKKEEVTKRQHDAIESYWEELKSTDLKAASSACGKLGEWVKAMKAI